MRKLSLLFCVFAGLLFSCSKEDSNVDPNPQQETKGYNMLLIGNSFFKPYAKHIDDLALDAGFTDHHATVVFRGGDNGRPINFWNDSTSKENLEIKAALDKGDIEIFGMTAGHEEEDPIEGHRAWIQYAIKNNPNIVIFIAIPQVDFPAEWDQFALENGYDTIQELYEYFVTDMVNHTMVDQLRKEFPTTKIFSIPTGWSSMRLAEMQQAGQLKDEITPFGAKATSLFVDAKGHQGQIIEETGTLVWLNSIYKVDLSKNQYDTGFNTDLHSIAKNIMDDYDPNYKF